MRRKAWSRIEWLEQFKNFLQSVDRRIPSFLISVCSIGALVGTLYWTFAFMVCKARIMPVSYTPFLKQYMLDSESSFAFLFTILFLGAFVIIGILFLFRTVWNLAHGWLQTMCYDRLYLVVRPAIFMVVLGSTFNDIPAIKSFMLSHSSQMALILTTATGHAKADAKKIGGVVKSVKD